MLKNMKISMSHRPTVSSERTCRLPACKFYYPCSLQAVHLLSLSYVPNGMIGYLMSVCLSVCLSVRLPVCDEVFAAKRYIPQ